MSDAYYNRGIAYVEAQKYEAAVRDFDEVIRLNPKSADAFYNRGLAKMKAGKYEDAVDDYSEAMRINPKDPEAPFNRGLAYLRIDKYDYAARDFSEVDQACSRKTPTLMFTAASSGSTRVKTRKPTPIFKAHFRLNPALKKKLQPIIDDAKNKAKAKE